MDRITLLEPFLGYVMRLVQGKTFVDAKVLYYVERARFFGGKENLERAIRYLDRAMNLNPDNYYANFGLAYAYCQKKEFNRALDYADKAASSHTEGVSRASREMLDLVSLVIFEMVGKSVSSQTVVARLARQNDSDLGYVYSRVGFLFADLGIREKSEQWCERAEQWYENAITLDPRQSAYYYNLARVYSVESKFEKAKEKLMMALELAEDAKKKRAVLYELSRINQR